MLQEEHYPQYQTNMQMELHRGSPGVILSGTNVHTGYMGAGLKNFGWGWKSKGVPEECHQNERLVRNCSNTI